MNCGWKTSVLWVLLVAGCPETNTFADEDAGLSGVDASLEELDAAGGTVDAAAASPDVFVCPDVDGDGETDARCGGTDCDDEDAMLSSTQGPCGTPTAIHRCVAGAAADIECTGETPYCDARIGACVANACGDHVLHDGEACDEAYVRLCRDCRITCVTESQCPAGQVCHMGYDAAGDAAPVCGITNPEGSPDGSICTTDADCHSGHCDRYMGRCGILSYDTCFGPNAWSDSQLLYSSAVLRRTDFLPVCKYECLHRSECRDDAECVLAVALRTRYLLPTCVPVVRGAAELGEPCSSDGDCRSAVCALDRCTQVCRDDADCPSALPTCREVDLSDAPGDRWRFPEPRPDDWSSTWPQLCMPS